MFGGLAGIIVGLVCSLLVARGVLPPKFHFLSRLVQPGTGFFVTGCVMYWGSKVGKLHLRDKIIASISWRGDEQVLDVGCGHGLMLLAAAKRLTTGRAIGIDIWSQVDQADNSPEATMENARRENVAERVEVKSADARKIPFPDASFDVVVSSFVIHNLHPARNREQVIREIARVLRPGGQLAIADIRHTCAVRKNAACAGLDGGQALVPEFSFCHSDTGIERKKTMNDVDRNLQDYISMLTDRHPRIARTLALLLFLAGIVLCARIV